MRSDISEKMIFAADPVSAGNHSFHDTTIQKHAINNANSSRQKIHSDRRKVLTATMKNQESAKNDQVKLGEYLAKTKDSDRLFSTQSKYKRMSKRSVSAKLERRIINKESSNDIDCKVLGENSKDDDVKLTEKSTLKDPKDHEALVGATSRETQSKSNSYHGKKSRNSGREIAGVKMINEHTLLSASHHSKNSVADEFIREDLLRRVSLKVERNSDLQKATLNHGTDIKDARNGKNQPLRHKGKDRRNAKIAAELNAEKTLPNPSTTSPTSKRQGKVRPGESRSSTAVNSIEDFLATSAPGKRNPEMRGYPGKITRINNRNNEDTRKIRLEDELQQLASSVSNFYVPSRVHSMSNNKSGMKRIASVESIQDLNVSFKVLSTRGLKRSISDRSFITMSTAARTVKRFSDKGLKRELNKSISDRSFVATRELSRTTSEESMLMPIKSSNCAVASTNAKIRIQKRGLSRAASADSVFKNIPTRTSSASNITSAVSPVVGFPGAASEETGASIAANSKAPAELVASPVRSSSEQKLMKNISNATKGTTERSGNLTRPLSEMRWTIHDISVDRTNKERIRDGIPKRGLHRAESVPAMNVQQVLQKRTVHNDTADLGVSHHSYLSNAIPKSKIRALNTASKLNSSFNNSFTIP